MCFFTSEARLAFTKLKQKLIKILILHYLNLKYHIKIGTDVLNYAIGEVLSQFIANDLGYWHLIAFKF